MDLFSIIDLENLIFKKKLWLVKIIPIHPKLNACLLLFSKRSRCAHYSKVPTNHGGTVFLGSRISDVKGYLVNSLNKFPILIPL